MRLLAYKLLTQAILALGNLRAWVITREWLERPKGRVFDFYSEDSQQCCDCKLVHEAKYFGPDTDCGHESGYPGFAIVGHMWPRRPVGYDYSWRKGAATPDLAKEKA